MRVDTVVQLQNGLITGSVIISWTSCGYESIVPQVVCDIVFKRSVCDSIIANSDDIDECDYNDVYNSKKENERCKPPYLDRTIDGVGEQAHFGDTVKDVDCVIFYGMDRYIYAPNVPPNLFREISAL